MKHSLNLWAGASVLLLMAGQAHGQATGACCLNVGGCVDNLTQVACEGVAGGGVWMGAGVLCANIACPVAVDLPAFEGPLNAGTVFENAGKIDSSLQEALNIIRDVNTMIEEKRNLLGFLDEQVAVEEQIDSFTWKIWVFISVNPGVTFPELEANSGMGGVEIMGVDKQSPGPFEGPDFRFFIGRVELLLPNGPNDPLLNLNNQPLWILAGHPKVVEVEGSWRSEPTLNVSTAAGKTAAGLHLGMGADLLQASPVGALRPWAFRGAGVVVGIIDSGIDFYHQDFRNNDGVNPDGTPNPALNTTRITHLWDQTLTAQGPEETPHIPFNFGVEYLPASINADFATPTPHSIVRQRDTSGHGTHVAGIAAGDGSSSGGNFVGVAPDADLIVVKIGNHAASIALGLQYIASRAGTAGKPWVTNISLGFANSGPHDGTSTRAKALTKHSGTGSVVVAAGNCQGLNIHKENDGAPIVAGAPASLSITVPPPVVIPPPPAPIPPLSPKKVVLEIYTNANNRLSVRVEPPRAVGGVPSIQTRPDDSVAGNDMAANSVGARNLTWTVGGTKVRVSVYNHRKALFGAGGTDQVITVILAPPEGERADYQLPGGVWNIQLFLNATLAGDPGQGTRLYDAYLMRTPSGRLFGGAFTAGAVADEMVNEIACPAGIIAVGSHISKAPGVPGQISLFSNIGPTRSVPGGAAGRTKPDLTAPGQAIESARTADLPPVLPPPAPLPQGLWLHTNAPLHVGLAGTSMAAPHVTGFVALMLSRNPLLRTNPPPAPAPPAGNPGVLPLLRNWYTANDAATAGVPNNTWGAGKLLASTDSDGDTLPNFIEDSNLNGVWDYPLETDLSDPDTDFDGKNDNVDLCPLDFGLDAFGCPSGVFLGCPEDCTPIVFTTEGDPDNFGNGVVNIDDLVAVLRRFGSPFPGPCDVNDSGQVDIDDLVAVLLAFGPCP